MCYILPTNTYPSLRIGLKFIECNLRGIVEYIHNELIALFNRCQVDFQFGIEKSTSSTLRHFEFEGTTTAEVNARARFNLFLKVFEPIYF